MKARYILAVVLLVILFFAFEVSLVVSNLSSQLWISQAIAGAGVFVALLAAVIALHSSDRRERRIAAKVVASIDRSKPLIHTWEEIPKPQRAQLTHIQKEFYSEKVNFAITNVSRFTWHKPTLCFHLPLVRQHPHRFERGAWTVGFNSNLYNFQDELRMLKFGDTAVIANSNLPFWNSGDEFLIWIRMALDAGGAQPFEVKVSFNAENAEGITVSGQVDPSQQAEP